MKGEFKSFCDMVTNRAAPQLKDMNLREIAIEELIM